MSTACTTDPASTRRRHLAVVEASRCVLLLMAVCTRVASAQVDTCDPQLKGKVDRANPSAYRQRNDRCEGIYLQDVSASGTLLVASLTATMAGFAPASGKPLSVDWKAVPGATKVNLRAYSLRPRLYYRMDTVRDAAGTPYQWPSGIAAAYGLNPADVGLVAWASVTVGRQRLEPVYVPVAIRDTASAPWPSTWRLVVVPPADLKELFLTIAPVDAHGDAGAPVRDGPLGYGYYPGGGPVKIDIAALPTPGIHLMQLAGLRRDGASIVTRLWIFQP